MMFDNIIGHDDQKAYFGNIINKHNISHSYIFYGEDGIGKLTFAKEFAKKVLNTDNLESCQDFKIINKLEDKKDIIVEQVRKEILDDIYIAPISGDHKVYIINDAELLNVAAQNALLKTLEEPPKYIVIILVCSNRNKILTTILSRANKINFTGIKSNQINEYLNKKFNTILSENVVNYVNGSLGKAINIVNYDLTDKFTIVDQLVKNIENKDVIASFDVIKNLDFQNGDIIQYFEYMLYERKLYSSIKYIEKAITRLKNNGNYDIVIDNMILKIIEEI